MDKATYPHGLTSSRQRDIYGILVSPDASPFLERLRQNWPVGYTILDLRYGISTASTGPIFRAGDVVGKLLDISAAQVYKKESAALRYLGLLMQGNELDPPLPAEARRRKYAKRKRGRHQKLWYPTVEEASIAARELGIRDRATYQARYHEDSRLPRNPHIVYRDSWEEFGAWPAFLNSRKMAALRKSRRTEKYATVEEASAAAQKLGITEILAYRKQRRRDLRLPGSPHTFYGQQAWDRIGRWPGFLGRLPKRSGRPLKKEIR